LQTTESSSQDGKPIDLFIGFHFVSPEFFNEVSEEAIP
jgi:hypothetical protein